MAKKVNQAHLRWINQFNKTKQFFILKWTIQWVSCSVCTLAPSTELHKNCNIQVSPHPYPCVCSNMHVNSGCSTTALSVTHCSTATPEQISSVLASCLAQRTTVRLILRWFHRLCYMRQTLKHKSSTKSQKRIQERNISILIQFQWLNPPWIFSLTGCQKLTSLECSTPPTLATVQSLATGH